MTIKVKTSGPSAFRLTSGLALVILASLLGGTSAQASEVDPASPKAQAQLDHESQLDHFLQVNPEPAPIDETASIDEQNDYAEALAAWWETVPWDAVAGQWGCESVIEEVVLNPVNADGVATASHGGMMQCEEKFSTEELAVISLPQPRGETENRRAANARYCDFPGGDDYCLARNGTTLTASFQHQSAGNKTGKARAGRPGIGQSCGLGTQIAIGPLGTGSQGAVWYASGTINQNSYYSSSFLVGSNSVFGSWCTLL